MSRRDGHRPKITGLRGNASGPCAGKSA